MRTISNLSQEICLKAQIKIVYHKNLKIIKYNIIILKIKMI